MDDTTQIRRLVPIPETRRLLGNIGHSTVYELVGRGELVKVNIGRRAFVTSDSINAYMDRLAQTYGSQFALHGPALRDLGILLGGGTLLGWVGAWLATGRHLARIEPGT